MRVFEGPAVREPVDGGKLEDAPTERVRLEVLEKAKRAMLSGSGKVSSSVVLPKYANKDLLMAAPNTKDLGIKAVEAGSELLGFLKLNKEHKETLRPKFRKNGQRGWASLAIPIRCSFGATANCKAPESRDKIAEIKEEKEDKESKEEEIEEKQRGCTIDWIHKKLKGDEQKKAFQVFGRALLERYPEHLPLLTLKLEIYEDTKDVVEIAEDILTKMDLNEMAAFFGKKSANKNGVEYKNKNKKLKEQRSAVIEALKAKLKALRKRLSTVSSQICPEISI